MKARLSLPAPAKLNLFLHITGRRADGYHLLQTLFQLLDYGDCLHFTPRQSPELSLSGNLPELESPDNLIIRAARLLQQHCGVTAGIHIDLDKKLPLGGGLGGGSSDAATTLLALNQLWDCRLSLAELAELGLQLGADVPVFVHGHSAWAEGLGEILTPMSLPQRWYLVLTPPCRALTGEIFCHEQLTRGTPTIKIPAFPVLGARNDCEQVACLLYPQIRNALDWLGQFAKTSMTGTGASVFAAFENKAEAERILNMIPEGLAGFIAAGVDESPVHRALLRASA